MIEKNKPAGATAGAIQKGTEMHDKYTPIPRISGSLNDAVPEIALPLSAQKSNDAKVLDQLFASYKSILDAAANDIVWTPAWVNLDGAPIFSKGTINVIQGKAGVHKSRLAETFCALLLSPHGTGDYLNFKRHSLGAGYYVAYIDTERNTQEHFPAAVQRIRERAGLDKKVNNGRFFPVSIKHVERKKRLEAVKDWINFVREEMERKGVSNWNLFVVLDVVTDCVASFNRDDETMALFDFLGHLCEYYGVAFLLILHENPFSEKARGHTGTEAMNKADTQIQIGYDSTSGGEETDLIKLKFLKTRNAARPKPLYLQYSKEKNGLAVADMDTVNDHIESKKKNKDIDLYLDKLAAVFDTRDSITQKELIVELMEEFSCVENTAKNKLAALIAQRATILNKEGIKCRLVKATQAGKPTIYCLEPIAPVSKADAKNTDDNSAEDAPY